jgi:hypothetical protein
VAAEASITLGTSSPSQGLFSSRHSKVVVKQLQTVQDALDSPSPHSFFFTRQTADVLHLPLGWHMARGGEPAKPTLKWLTGAVRIAALRVVGRISKSFDVSLDQMTTTSSVEPGTVNAMVTGARKCSPSGSNR